jgi:(2S)-methylsuccinyl-CoA dehydrogenase
MQRVVDAIAELYQRAHERLRAEVTEQGKLSRQKLEQRQVAAHGLAYLATELEAARQMAAWATRVGGDYERRLAAAYVGEVARGVGSAIDLGPCEAVDIHELGVTEADLE